MGKLLFSKKEVNEWLNLNQSKQNKYSLPKVILGSHDPLLEETLKRSNCGIAISFDGSIKGLYRMNNFGVNHAFVNDKIDITTNFGY